MLGGSPPSRLSPGESGFVRGAREVPFEVERPMIGGLSESRPYTAGFRSVCENGGSLDNIDMGNGMGLIFG